jgi:hypothetical protein
LRQLPQARGRDSLRAQISERDRFTIRAAREDDFDQLLDLHGRVFGRRPPREQRRWKLAGHTAPVENVWVAETDGRIVFQYAGIPVRFLHRGRVTWAMQSVDTMTDPDYRRRGLLTQTAAVTFENWTRARVAFVFGVPNQNWGRRLAALGFVQVGEVRWWVRWLDPLRALAAKVGIKVGTPGRAPHRPPSRRGRDAVRISLVDDPAPLDDLWTRASDEGVVKDAAWYRWRYLQAPVPFEVLGAANGTGLGGAAAFRQDGPSGIIAEVQTGELDIARALLARSCGELRAMGVARAALLIQSGTMLEEAALATGFVPRPHGFPVVAAALAGGLPRAALFQGGDFDVV